MQRLIPSTRVALLLTVLASTACVRATPHVEPAGANADVRGLWIEPADVGSRDLFYGSGGPELAPDTAAPFTLVSQDDGGFSPGYDVRGSDGTMWSVKLGPEAQTEVVLSRILWAVGYHQPPLYYVSRWTLTSNEAPAAPGRFRPDLPDWKVVDEWSWYDNRFDGTRAFKGLVVINLLLNNWDWKTSNNKVYEVSSPEGARQVHVVRDLGASLGRTSFPWLFRVLRINAIKQGTRNDIAGFESQMLIKAVDGDRIEFDYRGIHGPLLKTVSRADVVWAATLLSRLTDAQWDSAFRAAEYDEAIRARYIAKIKAKIAEGLALADR